MDLDDPYHQEQLKRLSPPKESVMTHDSQWLRFRDLRFRVNQLNGYRADYTDRPDAAFLVVWLSGYAEPITVPANRVEVQEWATRLDRLVREGVG